MAVIPHPPHLLIWHSVTSSYFQKWNCSWKDAGLIPLSRSRPNRKECLTLWQKRTSRKRSRNGGDDGTGVYKREGTTSRVMAADRTYDEFCNFYSLSPEYIGCQIATHHVTRHNTHIHNILSTAPQLSIYQKALGTLPEDGNVMPKHVGATVHN
jgi:hypothetical protein